MVIFLLDLAAEVYVEHKYGVHKNEEATYAFIQHEHHLDVEPDIHDCLEFYAMGL